MEKPEISAVEIRVHQFIIDYGAEQLLIWLQQFDKVINSKDYPLYRNLERTACMACDISIADMHKFSTTPCTNAKRIIAFLAVNKLKLSVASTANLLGIGDRNINYYLKDVEEWLMSPKANKSFIEQYNKVLENLKSE